MAAGYLSFDDVYGAASGVDRRGKASVEVYVRLHKGGKKRTNRVVLLQCTSQEQAERLLKTIRATLVGCNPQGPCAMPCMLLFV